ncbi:hypothetical protein AABB24_017685 [Solanum stoloniferum]|uniref:Uncharacterized protein n=1 Tax=Solanum stoloniferum TaxID=62892 RepID=A0ABD2TM86_9SOLN
MIFHPILSSKMFCNSAARQGTSRTPFCWNPYSSSACFNNFKNNGLLSQCSSTINFFGSSSGFTENTAKCPSLTSFGTTSLFLNFLIIILSMTIHELLLSFPIYRIVEYSNFGMW